MQSLKKKVTDSFGGFRRNTYLCAVNLFIHLNCNAYGKEKSKKNVRNRANRLVVSNFLPTFADEYET